MTEVRVDTDGDIRHDTDSYLRSLAPTGSSGFSGGTEIRVDTSGDLRRDTGGFLRVTTSPLDPIRLVIEPNKNNRREVFDAPPPELLAAFTSGHARVVRFVDIYEADNVTPYRLNVGVTDGNVTVDSNRDERRILDIVLAGENGNIKYGPDDFWYDKVIKPYRGITVGGVDLVTCLGEFMIDRIVRPHFPNTLAVSARDFTKKLMQAKLVDTTTFAISLTPESIIKALAINSGIPVTKMSIPYTGVVLPNTSTFDRLTPVWTIIKTIAGGFGYDVFFDNFGILTMRKFVDPLTAPVSHTFKTGAQGNLSSFEITAEDTRLFNEVVVYGTGNTNKLIMGVAQNTEPSSPTRIARIGRRTTDYPSQFVNNLSAANDLAKKILAVSALEQYDVSATSIVAPWLEGGDASEFLSPDRQDHEPTRFLLTNFTIPLGLSAMSAQMKRIHIVGGA